MASQMVVAPSKDTLFVRGFSARKDVEDVRDFFEKESRSKVMIEFLKQTEQDDRLFVALRFETKEIAKDVLNRYDNTEVLGDKITLTWFKDLRRARFKDRHDGRRPRYDNYDNYGHSGSYSRYNSHNRSRMDNRNRNRSSRRYSRSLSRSESRSVSRSRSRERDRDNRRGDSRSPSPRRRHKLKSEVQTASRHKAEDSDNEPSSPLKESSMSPDRAYDSDPPSPDDRGTKDRTPPRDSSKNSESKSSRRNEQKDTHDEETPNRYRRESLSESYEDNRYHDDKYSVSSRQQQNRSQQQSRYDDDNRGQESQNKSVSRYSVDMDERALMEGRWSSHIDPSPSRMSEGNDRTSTTSQDRILASNMDRSSHGERMSSMDMENSNVDRRRENRSSGRGPTDRGSGRMEPEERSRPYDYDSTMWDSGGALARRSDGFHDQFGERNEQVRGGSSNKTAAGDSDRWLSGMDTNRWAKDGPALPTISGGWSQQTMKLIQDKKEDIEKVYKNDCETFVSVVKMLISKDPLLEDQLQHSLRENLKEVGQRCILELREFIDKLREKEDSMIGGAM